MWDLFVAMGVTAFCMMLLYGCCTASRSGRVREELALIVFVFALFAAVLVYVVGYMVFALFRYLM